VHKRCHQDSSCLIMDLYRCSRHHNQLISS
jgi:hypothetical protein